MGTALLSPVFKAQPEAQAEALETLASDKDAGRRDQVVALLTAILPEVEETPIRMKRLNNALVEWILRGPRPWREVEESRQEFVEIFDSQSANVARILTVATQLGFPAEEPGRLSDALAELRRLREHVFANWQAFTPVDFQPRGKRFAWGKFTTWMR
jgi:hypothetical protein